MAGSAVTAVVPRPRQVCRLRPDATRLTVFPWPESADAGDRFPVRHPYVEAFYAPSLGPTATLLLRRFGLGLAVHPTGYHLDVDYLAAALGLGAGRGRHSPLVRSLDRLVWMRSALWVDVDTMAVRTVLPRAAAGMVAKMPPQLQAEHAQALLDWERPQ